MGNKKSDLFTSLIEKMRKSDRCELSEQFENTFHEKPQQYMEMIRWELSIDIFKFEEMLKSKYWYDDSISMIDFVERKFWKEASELIEKMF